MRRRGIVSLVARRVLVGAQVAAVVGFAAVAGAQPGQSSGASQAKTLDELLDMVRKGGVEDRSEYQKREAEFRAAREQQATILKQTEARRDALEKKSGDLEKAFQENERTLGERQAALNERLGSLRELFGVFQQVAGDAQALFRGSMTNAQYPERGEFLLAFAKKMGRASQIASIEEIERLWFEMQREMTEAGKIVKFPATVTLADGDTAQREVVRVGVFNVVSEGEYLQYAPETGRLTVLPRQPSGRYQRLARNFQNAGDSGLADFAIDPSRGSILALLVQTPGLRERTGQGGPIGYMTLALGLLGFLLAMERLYALTGVGRKVREQMGRAGASTDNPLGRVLKVYEDHPRDDPEALERKLDEAILKEVPPLNRFLSFLKIIAVVAPLMGLLGTVTGMIKTFQAITLYGTGDPKLMAGGISEALVTTVIGLCVAIPMLLLHSLVSSRSRNIVHVLEEQTAGMIAGRAEVREQEEGRMRVAGRTEPRPV